MSFGQLSSVISKRFILSEAQAEIDPAGERIRQEKWYRRTVDPAPLERYGLIQA